VDALCPSSTISPLASSASTRCAIVDRDTGQLGELRIG
jgi:hypothetical protein